MSAAYVIATGWWCGEKHHQRPNRKALGDDTIRAATFHHLWYGAVNTFTTPEKIIVVDSASPIKPPLNSCDKRFEVIELPVNLGHPTDHRGFYSGWTASVIVSLAYALCSDIEYYVYVEQDAILYGENIIEQCIQRMKRPLMFGAGAGTPQALQQSFFIVRRDGMRQFLHRLCSIEIRDRELGPEWKFFLASSDILRRLPSLLLRRLEISPRVRKHLCRSRYSRGFDTLPVGFGRARPIDFSASHYYFQHGTQAELNEYVARVPRTVTEKFVSAMRELGDVQRVVLPVT